MLPIMDKYDKYNQLWNTAKAYDPKIVKFKPWCKTFNNNEKILTYQVTRGKVESFLTYVFFVRQRKEGSKREYQEGLTN